MHSANGTLALAPDELVADGRLDRGADWHLRNWSNWMRGYQPGLGYRNRSAGLECMTSSTYDDMTETSDKLDRQHARISDAIVESLILPHQLAIRNVYLCDVWRFRGDPVDVFVDAAARFWEIARRRGLE